jgi:hypothetical protein
MSPTEHAGVKRYSVPRPVVRQKLTLKARNIDADGAFGFAGAALQA